MSSNENPKKDITSWASKDGQFRRQDSSFRSTISKDGPFTPDSGRYLLIVSYACPWAHRTLIVRHLKGLEKHIKLAVVHPFMGSDGWSWKVPEERDPSMAGVVEDPLYGMEKIREFYFKAEKEYQGRFTVPLLWDSKNETIVNNESSEIIRMFNHEFDTLLESPHSNHDYYPNSLRSEIDSIQEWIYPTVNNGVYRSGFATSTGAYEEAVKGLFESLEKLENILAGKEFVVGGELTEVDIRLFTTIVRFDPVYVGHFKCNINTIRSGFPNLHKWMRNLYWNYPAFKDTTNFEHIKYHYYTSHPQINPTRIVPVGPIPSILPLDV